MHIIQRCKLFWLTGCIGLFIINGFLPQQTFAFQTGIWVSPAGNDTSGDGSSGSPYKTINFAAATISSNDTILLAPGTYQENVVFDNIGDFVLRSGSVVDTAHIEAIQPGPAIYVNGGEVTLSRKMVIENVLISHASGIAGSGVYLDYAGITLKNNRIFNNQENIGAGVYIVSDGADQPLVQNNIIETNSADTGAGIYCEDTPAMVRSNVFRHNTAISRGGASHFLNCYGLNILENTFYANTADSGGAVSIQSNSVSLTTTNRFRYNLVYKNSAMVDGAGLYYEGIAGLIWNITNNTFAENHSTGNGGAGVFNAAATVVIQGNNIVQNSADNNGGAFVFRNMSAAAGVNLWSNNITGNIAGNNGGAIYINNVGQLTVGGAINQSNNLFHNRDNSKLNNITALNTISTLNLSQNFWGYSDSLSVLQQLSIPALDQNFTWQNFVTAPIDIKTKLFRPRHTIWFADGRLDISNGYLQPTGDSTIVIRTHPDTSFVLNVDPALLKKVFHFDWDNVNLSAADAQLTFFLDETELVDLGNPFYQNLRIFQYDTPNWSQTSTNADVSGTIISTTINDLAISDFTIGIDLNASDTLLVVTPRPNQANVNKNEPISIQFQKAMEQSSLNKNNIAIHGSKSGLHDFLSDFDPIDNRLYLTVIDPFQAGEQVTVTLSDSLKTLSGEKFNGYAWQYTTSAFRGNTLFQALNLPQDITGSNRYCFNDFDGDLRPELIELSDTKLTVFTLNDDGSYSGTSQALSSVFHLMKLADLNNDYVNDIVIFDDSQVFGYSYKKGSGFTQVFNRTFPAGDILNDVEIFDFNNDNVPDIAFLKDVSDFRQFECYYGVFDGTYGLGSASSIILNGPANTMSICDWNADGLFDLIVSNGSSTANLALITNQKSSFSSTINTLSEIYDQQAIATANVWDDLQFQNQSEIIVAGATETSELLKLFNVDGNGSFKETHKFPVSGPINQIASGDLNSDGYTDLAVCTNKKLKLILSNSSGTISDTMDIKADIAISDLQIADFDADGDLDLFVYERGDGNTLWQILENETRNPRSWWVNNQSKNGDGSFVNPFGKINEAIAKTFEKDTIYVFPGNYSENITIKHSLLISSADATPVTLNPVPGNFFKLPTIEASNINSFSLNNFILPQESIIEGSVGLNIQNIDSLSLSNIQIQQYDNALRITSSKGTIMNLSGGNSIVGIDLSNSELDLLHVKAENNSSNGMLVDNSQLKISESSFRENGLENNAANSGINISNGSTVSLDNSESTRNGNANIQIDNSELTTHFVYSGQAISNGQSSEGNGINLRNNATINLYNTVLDNNYKIGIALDNSSGVIQNSIFVNNDSLKSQNGGGIFARAGSDVKLKNSIILGNNSALNSSSSTIDANYNNFYGNAAEPSSTLLGTGNTNENPLLVFMYNPLSGETELNGFSNAKLAPGSPLIDRGDPNLTNGSGLSRSDIGLFGDIGLPQTFESIPVATTQSQDSSVIISWDPVSADEQGIWAATAIFRSITADFQPDTSQLVDIVSAGTNRFIDSTVVYGTEYYYRLAYVDTNGGANAYSAPISGRIDYSEITLQKNALNVQLGQGDSLKSNVIVRNTGTLPVTIYPKPLASDWLSLSPDMQAVDRSQNAVFQIHFNAQGLERDSLYRTTVQFTTAEDTAINIPLTVRMLVSYRDLKAPQITLDFQYPDTIRQSRLTFLYSASDSINTTIGTPTRLLRYVYRFAARIDNRDTLLSADTTDQKRLDFYPLNNGRYIFQIAALDTAGNGGFGVNSVISSVVVKISDLTINQKLWQMITVPRQMLNSVQAISSESVQALRHWKDGIYEYVTVDSILPGKGYWIISKDRKNIDLTKFPMVPSQDDFMLKVDEGWNMIGNPWSWDISIDSMYFVDQNNNVYTLPAVVNAGIYTWTSTHLKQGYSLEARNQLRINLGYWMKFNRPGMLYFKARPSLNIDLLPVDQISFSKSTQNGDGLVRFMINQGNETDEDNYFGICQDKSIYPFFMQDAIEPPVISDGIRLFSQKEKEQLTTNLVLFSEFDSTYVWDLKIENNKPGIETVLKWQFLKAGNTLNYFIYNLETGQWFNLANQKDWYISSTKSTIPLKLYATVNENFTPDILPIKFSLSQNYPNPFNPSTSIKFSVPYFADGVNAQIDIFDVLGRKVKNILNKKVKSGEIEVTWTGINEFGSQVASGIYFYRLKAGDFVASRKMILIK